MEDYIVALREVVETVLDEKKKKPEMPLVARVGGQGQELVFAEAEIKWPCLAGRTVDGRRVWIPLPQICSLAIGVPGRASV